MAKKSLKPGNLVYPIPAALISVADNQGHSDLVTVAWTGTICSEPPMLSISVRPERFSHHMLMEKRAFVWNLTTEAMLYGTDLCGVKSGRDIDKWAAAGFTQGKSDIVDVPLVNESPVNLECKVTEVEHLGSHDLFLAEVVAVHADERYLDENGKLDLAKMKPVVYNHGHYHALGDELGFYGHTVKKSSN